jgi:RimJ/RimL family protein N-acetyltransferase
VNRLVFFFFLLNSIAIKSSEALPSDPVFTSYNKAKHFTALMDLCRQNSVALGQHPGQPSAHSTIPCEEFKSKIENLSNSKSVSKRIQVIEVDAEVQGFILYGLFYNVESGEILDLCVIEDSRSQGIGSQLLNKAEQDYASHSTIKKAFVVVVEGHERAMNFYQKHGYRHQGKFLGKDLVLEKDL